MRPKISDLITHKDACFNDDSAQKFLVNVEWESRAIFLTIYDDLYKTYLWGTCITLNLFVALTAASESIYDVINVAAILLYMNYSYIHQNQLKTSHYCLFCEENV